MPLRPAVILVVLLVLPGATLPFVTAQIVTPTPGFFIDDGRRQVGAATVSATLTGSTLGGSLTVANQSMTFTASWIDNVDAGGTFWARYRGTVDVGGQTRPLSAFYNASLGAFIGEIVKPDLGSLVVYATNPADRSEVHQIAMQPRQGYASVLSYNVLAAPNLAGKLSRPVMDDPLDPNHPGGIVSVELGPIAGGLIPQGVPGDGMEGIAESRYGPRNNDYGADAFGGRLEYQVGMRLRDDRYLSSYDELPLGVPYYKHMSVMAWSPTLGQTGGSPHGTMGTMRMEVFFAERNWNLDPNPIAFFEATTFPTHQYNQQVTIDATFGIGYGPLGVSLTANFIDTAGGGTVVQVASKRTYAEVDWSFNDPPVNKDEAIGAHLGIGAFHGADGNYDTFTRIVAAYWIRQAVSTNLNYMFNRELVSAPAWVEHGIQASAAWTKQNGKVADVRDYDVADRAVTPALGAGGTPTERTNYYLRPWPGETRNIISWFQLDGPICHATEFELYVDRWVWDYERYEDVDLVYVPVQPPPGTCYPYVRIAYTAVVNYFTHAGHYQVYIAEVPLDGESANFLDVADYIIGEV